MTARNVHALDPDETVVVCSGHPRRAHDHPAAAQARRLMEGSGVLYVDGRYLKERGRNVR